MGGSLARAAALEDTEVSAEAGPAITGGPDEHVRRVRLPADRRTPAAARALVRSVLAEAHLDELLNEALLLTTELTTNAVEHARTELDIEVVADDVGLTVTVSDFAPGPVDDLTVGVRNDNARDQRGLRAGSGPAAGGPLRQPVGHHVPAHRQGRLVPAGPSDAPARPDGSAGRQAGTAGAPPWRTPPARPPTRRRAPAR